MSQKERYDIWKINDVELSLDLDDADEYDNLMTAFDEMDKVEKEVEKDKNPIRAYCDMWYQFYDAVFGSGTGQKVFKGRHNARVCDETYENFLAFLQKQGEGNAKRRMGIGNKYMPNRGRNDYQGNRQQRRKKNKQRYNNRYSGPYAL